MAITVKHKFVSAIPDAGDPTIVQPSNWNDTHDLTGTVPITNGGTGAATANDGFNALAPSQTGNSGKYLTTDGTDTSWATNPLGTVTSVSGTSPVNVATGTTTPVVSLAASYGDTQNPYASKTANYVLAAPDGSAGVPTFRALTSTDIPTLSYIPYTGASSAVDLNAKSLVNVSNLGVNTTTVPTIKIRAVGDNNSGSRIAMRGYSSDANSSAIRVTKFRGTTGAPQAPQSGDSLGKFELAGYGTTSSEGYPQGSYEGVATEAWGATARGTKVLFKVTPNTTITQVTALTIDQDKSATFAGSVTATSFSGSGSSLTGVVTSVTGTSPVVSSGGQTPAISMPAATTTTNGYLTSTDWNTFNGKGSGSVTSVSGTGTVNGLTLTGTVTTTGSLTLGGTLDLSSPPTIGNTAPNTGKFTTLESTGTASLGTTSTTYVTITGDASYPMVKATGGTNTPLVLSPLGTGALQAQKTDSTTTGGNARGANAVDWQTNRSVAGNVASATNSVIGGGNYNTASGAQALVAGGSGNTASNSFSNASGGQSNTASGVYSTVNGGASNTVSGYFNYVGGGYVNSGTSGSAVTTQSGTMNATTAVTLSGSNASIKVGQYITGTSIAAFTYVAAISGTSLTLSQAASGSSTSTLSFYTPHGVVVGGGNNQATGSYSFIGGGGDAGTAANRNTASGDWSVVAGGRANTASGIGSFIGGGGTDGGVAGNTASGLATFVGGGLGNNASGIGASILGGYNNTSNSNFGVVLGRYGTTRGIVANTIFAANNQSIGANTGVAQSALLVLAKQTTDATPTILVSDPNAASATNQVILPNNSAYYFKVRVIAGVTGAGNTKAWTLEGAIKRGAGVGTTAIVGTVTTTIVAADVGAATWTVTATADTTNGGLAITFTGQAATTIRTVAKVETAEMTF